MEADIRVCQGGLGWVRYHPRRGCSQVENGAHIHEGQKLERSKPAPKVHEGIGASSGHPIAIPCLLLMLTVSLRLIVRNEEGLRRSVSFSETLEGSTIADQSVHCSPLTNVVRESIDKLLGGLHAIGITTQCVPANQNVPS